MVALDPVSDPSSAQTEKSFHYRVMPLSDTMASSPRFLHGIATNSVPRYLRRVASVGFEIALASIVDPIAPLPPASLEIEAGRQHPDGASFALYLHWSPDGRISSLVRRQVALWRQCGFAVVFLSNSSPPHQDWDAVGAETILRVRRCNVGRDFSAWRDGLRLVHERYGRPQEVLLTNDSVLGPFMPLHPLVGAWRASGDGLFGMTESLGGGPHLQSYALLARGAGPVSTLSRHIAESRDSRSKWRLIQRGEIGLSQRMLTEGHFCGALFDYATLCEFLDEESRLSLGPRFARLDAAFRFPLNPTHHLWRQLWVGMGFPYFKRELLCRMTEPLSRYAPWRPLLSTAEAALIEEHMHVMGMA